jgi:hypothetical protein
MCTAASRRCQRLTHVIQSPCTPCTPYCNALLAYEPGLLLLLIHSHQRRCFAAALHTQTPPQPRAATS